VPHSLVLSDSTVGRVDGRTFVFIRSLTDGALDAASWGMFHIRCFTATLLHRNRVGIAIFDGFDELTAFVPEIEQIPQEARFSCPYE
jgi:hypothetical protein